VFNHIHPYEPYLFPEATKLIVGTLPPPRFTIGALKEQDVDFCYGSKNGQLWPILNRMFNLGLVFENSAKAIAQRKAFLREYKIGVCDIVASAQRSKIDASDLGMEQVQLRNIIQYLKDYPNINTLLFMGGNSKNGPEYFFRRLLKEQQLKLEVVSNIVPRIHQVTIEDKITASKRVVKTVSLTAPSGAANRAVGSLQSYKDMKNKNPEFTTLDFRIAQYSPFFEAI